MSPFVPEAFFIGVKEGAKIALCACLVRSFVQGRGRAYLAKPLAAGLLVVFLLSFAVMSSPATLPFRELAVKLIGYVFGLFYLLSLAALFQDSGTDMLGPLARLFEKRPVLGGSVCLLTVVYFVPDMAGASLYIADLAAMAGRPAPVLGAAAVGFIAALVLGAFLAARVRVDLSKIFGLPQVVLVLALTKLAAGGVRGFAELSLIPSVQAGLVKFIHDMVHQTFLFLMVPDHQILSTTAWTFIGALFGDTMGQWLSLVIILLPLLIFLRKHFSGPVPVPGDIPLPARRRIFLRAVRDQRVLRSVPVFLFMLFILGAWFVQKGDAGARLYKPEPTPIVAAGGKAVIPIQSPAEDLRDGSIHKFSLTLNRERVRLLIMKKPDGTLAVCLDACTICQPEGYGQAREHVVCLYCNTPIPFEAVGKPGGCNPVPLAALITDRDVQVDVAEISEKWSSVQSGGGRKGGEP